MPRRAFLAKRPALRRLDRPPQHIARTAQRRLLGMNACNVEALFGIEFAIGLAQPPAAPGNDADSPPRPVRYLKHFAQQLLRGLVSVERHDALVGVLHLVPSRL